MDPNATPTPPPVEEEELPALNPLDIVKFIWTAARRNPLTCFTVCGLALGIGLAVISAIPRKYESTSKVFVSATGLITSQLTSGHRLIGEEGGTKDLYESVFNHANLVALAREAELVQNWPNTRNWAQRLIDRVNALRGTPSPRDMEDMLVAMLERMIEVKPEDSASIRFRASWRDPATAQKLTMLLQKNYIAAKELEELSAITRATTVLEDELKRADSAFEPAVTELKNQIQQLRDRSKSKLPLAAARPTPWVSVEAIAARPNVSPLELTAKLNAIREEERAVLEPWQRRTAELKFQLADLRAVYGPAHPTVVTLEAKLRAAAAEPLELLDIRQREAQLKTSIASLAGGGPVRSGVLGATRAAAAPEAEALREAIGSVVDDPSLAPARLQLEAVLRKSQEMQARLDGARMELAIARVGFKYRYRQVEPARMWLKPISPKVPMLTAVAIGASLLLGLLAGAGRELITGKIMEMWQVKQLGLDVVATVDVRGWQSPDSTGRSGPFSRNT
jgi:hypothetical protein